MCLVYFLIASPRSSAWDRVCSQTTVKMMLCRADCIPWHRPAALRCNQQRQPVLAITSLRAPAKPPASAFAGSCISHLSAARHGREVVSSPLLAGDQGEPNVPVLPCRTDILAAVRLVPGAFVGHFPIYSYPSCRLLPLFICLLLLFGILGAFTAEVRDAGAKFIMKIHRLQ